jgi:hypothetical protein
VRSLQNLFPSLKDVMMLKEEVERKIIVNSILLLCNIRGRLVDINLIQTIHQTFLILMQMLNVYLTLTFETNLNEYH